MNKAILMGRLTRDPEVRYSQGEKAMCVARYTLAVNRRFRREGESEADFINCVAFGKAGEFAEKYLKQGTKILIAGRIQTGSYTNREGQKIYTTEVVVEEQEFAESKRPDSQAPAQGGYQNQAPAQGGYPQQNAPAQGGYPQQNAYQQAPQGGYQQQAPSQQPPQQAPAQGGYQQTPPPQGNGFEGGYMMPPGGEMDEELPFI